MASASSISTSNGAGCTSNLETGQSIEFGTKVNPYTEEGEVFVQMKIVLGQNKIKTPDCNKLFEIEVEKQALELQKAKLQLELLKAQIEAAKANANETVNTGDDW